MHPVSRRPLLVSLTRLAALPLIMAGAFACAPASINVQVNLVTQMCSTAQKFPYNGATIQFTIYGQGVNSEGLQTTSTIQSGVANIPSIPAGSARNIVAQVLDGNNDVVAHGETGPVDINGKSMKLVLTLFIRPVGMFVPANSAAAPQTCTQLTTARVAHTATVLDNGKVLIAGGYSVSGGMTSYLSSTEIYDPQAGTTTAGPSMSTARAYAAAAHLPGTPYTIIIGGENASAGNPNGGALGTGEVYDENQQQFVGVPSLVGAAQTGGITRAVAAVPLAVPGGGQPGVVLIFGGNDYSGTPQSQIMSFDPNDGFLNTGLTMPEGRSEAGAVPIPGGVLVFGGLGPTSTALRDVTGLTSPDNSHFAVFSTAVTLSSGHIFPIVGALADGSILTLDGLSSVAQSENLLSSATNVMDWVSPDYENTIIAPQPPTPLPTRGWGGGTTLLDGTLLAAGGGYFNGSRSTALADGTILSLSNGAVASRPVGNTMQNGRVGATYTLLTDGTVLITGGYDFDSSGNPDSVQSIDVYQPEYQTTSTSAHQIIQ